MPQHTSIQSDTLGVKSKYQYFVKLRRIEKHGTIKFPRSHPDLKKLRETFRYQYNEQNTRKHKALQV